MQLGLVRRSVLNNSLARSSAEGKVRKPLRGPFITVAGFAPKKAGVELTTRPLSTVKFKDR